ncbi:uncharacterized protein PGRI_078320 [Penicillium griseofulvum]|uniref:Uncharacterized protein n=1 Tax=Penicillium patulum TaxID=5078 RepID=A0A135M0F3_PENPA|nr:uncharacterized protein PGRI_078320 [Penicillium griseofulvum]KXG54688.1 hypothetical protein PGRI_078320 [Penicillium griseofulvum]
MSSAFSADTPALNFIQTSTHLSSEPFDLVTVTSIETETIYPTWIYTISGSGPDSSTVVDLSTLNPTLVTVTLTTKLSTTKQDTTISTSSAPVTSKPPILTLITTSPSPIGDLPISATSESFDPSWHSDAPGSTWTPPVSLTSSSISSSSVLVFPGTATSSMSSISTSASSSNAPSDTPTVSPFVGTATSATSSETAQDKHPSPTSSKTGTIVGSIIGGSAITIFALLACALYIRRRRRKIATELLGIRQKLIRTGSASSSISYHHRYHSYPSIPGNIGLRSPILPVIPLQQQPSNPDLSLDSMYLRGERTAQGPFTTPSTIIEISAPSRSVSLYSTSSRGVGRGGQGYWDCERDGVDALAIPDGYSDTPMMRDSMRSDPFDLDLEPPPNAHHRRSSAPSIPTTWGVKF